MRTSRVYMWRCVAALSSLLLYGGCTLRLPETFTVRSEGAPSPTQIQYYLTGTFGGHRDSSIYKGKGGVNQIPLFVDRRTERPGRSGTPAKTLKAILYAPGCQFRTLSVDLTATLTRSATYECRSLPTITLRGVIAPPLPEDPGQLDVEILYLAAWDHQFFGFIDGSVGQFRVGNTPLIAGGRFQLDIPDFSKDDITNQMQDADLEPVVIERSTGNLVKTLAPPAEMACRYGGLKILPRYDSEITFHGR